MKATLIAVTLVAVLLTAKQLLGDWPRTVVFTAGTAFISLAAWIYALRRSRSAQISRSDRRTSTTSKVAVGAHDGVLWMFTSLSLVVNTSFWWWLGTRNSEWVAWMNRDEHMWVFFGAAPFVIFFVGYVSFVLAGCAGMLAFGDAAVEHWLLEGQDVRDGVERSLLATIRWLTRLVRSPK
jgi:hypothetical protein